MAQRRMFSPDIVESEEFLDMPHSSQSLYFHLAMRADDDGFVQPKIVMRLIGANVDDLKILLGKRFLLSFQSGVVVVKHWLIHNLIRADLYKPSRHTEEKKMIGVKDNGSYTEIRDGIAELKEPETPEWLKKRRGELRTANVPQTALRLGKVRKGKERETPLFSKMKYLTNVPDEDIREFTTRFQATEQQVKSKAEDLKNWCDMNGKRKKNYKLFLLNALKKDFSERPEDEKQKPKQRVKKDSDGNPVIVNGVVQTETV